MHNCNIAEAGSLLFAHNCYSPLLHIAGLLGPHWAPCSEIIDGHPIVSNALRKTVGERLCSIWRNLEAVIHHDLSLFLGHIAETGVCFHLAEARINDGSCHVTCEPPNPTSLWTLGLVLLCHVMLCFCAASGLASARRAFSRALSWKKKSSQIKTNNIEFLSAFLFTHSFRRVGCDTFSTLIYRSCLYLSSYRFMIKIMFYRDTFDPRSSSFFILM